MTMTELADIMGKDHSAIYLMLKNGNPTLRKIEELAEALGVSVAFLVDEDDELGNTPNVVCPHCGGAIEFKAGKKDVKAEGDMC
ncbi:MAG: helix-turn-helix transcriptional regulator [Marinilabiliaceae bacterium]|nr:helix-turn-helix transcriptional regulator [Marinilabiliaceae bacterium]